MSNTNITNSTRDTWLRTVVQEVFLRLPLLAILMEHRRITWRGGKSITKTVVKDDMESLAQSYTVNEGLTGGTKTILAKPQFYWKYFQLPIEYGIEEEIQNHGAPDEVAPVDLVETLTTVAHKSARLKLQSMLYGDNSGAATDTGSANFQGLIAALDHSVTYGTRSRSTTKATGALWQSISLTDAWTDQDTATAASISNLRNAVARCRRYRPQNSKLYVICGEAIFQQFQSQVEARHLYDREGKTGTMAKYGFKTFDIDGVEFIQESYLTTLGTTVVHNSSYYPATWFFIIDPETWELRFHPSRAMKMTGFTWQGDQVGGQDKWLARIMTAGNLVCWQPNANCFLSNVS